MNGWFLAIIILRCLNIGLNLGKHGQSVDDEYNFFTSLVAGLITIGMVYMAIKTGF